MQEYAEDLQLEGANILTRTMIVFGQGAIRCHPYAYKQVIAVGNKDTKSFDKAKGAMTDESRYLRFMDRYNFNTIEKNGKNFGMKNRHTKLQLIKKRRSFMS